MTSIDASAGPFPADQPVPAPAAPAPWEASQPVAPVEELPPGHGRARFLGNERVFWRLITRGSVLLLVTLGIYRFWLATDVRRFLWNNSEIAGDSLEYTGTARELLLGFLIAIALLAPLNVLIFAAAFFGGTVGRLSGIGGLAVLALLGQFAVYRARRYRLTRTVYRGIRFLQTGSAWRYAVCALFWWGMIAITLGLAYPFAQASLERLKMRNTFYGDLPGRFEGSGFRLLFRGFLLWALVMLPFLLGLMAGLGQIDWTAVSEAIDRGGTRGVARLEEAGVFQALAVVGVAVSWAVLVAAVLYPVFQAMTLRWWISGLRFGELSATSRLRTGAVYGLYMRFVGYALLAGFALGVLSIGVLLVIGGVKAAAGDGRLTEVLTIALPIGTYVIAALAYSAIYQATVKLRLWKLGIDTLELTGIDVLDRVKASGAASSAVGEGLADALNVGGI